MCGGDALAEGNSAGHINNYYSSIPVSTEMDDWSQIYCLNIQPATQPLMFGGMKNEYQQAVPVLRDWEGNCRSSMTPAMCLLTLDPALPYRHLNAISKPTFSLILNWRHKRL